MQSWSSSSSTLRTLHVVRLQTNNWKEKVVQNILMDNDQEFRDGLTEVNYIWKEHFSEAVTAGHNPGVTKMESEFRVTDFVQRKTEITQVGLIAQDSLQWESSIRFNRGRVIFISMFNDIYGMQPEMTKYFSIILKSTMNEIGTSDLPWYRCVGERRI